MKTNKANIPGPHGRGMHEQTHKTMPWMKKIFKLIAVVIFRIDKALYKTFGIVSSFRRDAWTRQGKRLQRDLDREHSKRDYLNALHGTNYTTKQALALRKS